jgi:hypothetical protein
MLNACSVILGVALGVVATIWTIWKVRNSAVFDNVSLMILSVLCARSHTDYLIGPVCGR